MRLFTIAALSLFALLSTGNPALCTDNEKGKLLACLFEVEKTMVLYTAIYDGGLYGKIEFDASGRLQEQIARSPANSAQQQSAMRALDDYTRKELNREKEIENKLMSRCMMQGGYWYVGNNKDADCVSHDSKNERISEFSPFCWVPAPQSVTPFAQIL